jgi:hypothetical protein
MFERYTEKARRVIFYARYEASQFGSPYIETEHILLAVLRENKEITRLILPAGAVESIRKQIETKGTRVPKSATSIDLPLSNESKRVLTYGAEEAERLQYKHIGSDHLFLGLLREGTSFSARLLKDHGIDLENARQQILASLPTDQPEKRVTVHGFTLEASYVKERVKSCRAFFWRKRDFLPSDIVVHRGDGGISFDVTLAVRTIEFDPIKGGWKEEGCEICHWKLQESNDPERGTGYTNGRHWLCTDCYEKFVAPDAKGLNGDVST